MSMLPAKNVIVCGEGKTKAKVGYETDLNKIIAKYKKTGMLNIPENKRVLQYADVSTVGTYQECLDKIADIENIFHAIPSKIRDRFKNSPMEYMQFIESLPTNEENQKLAIELGILEIPEKKQPSTTAAKATANNTEVK